MRLDTDTLSSTRITRLLAFTRQLNNVLSVDDITWQCVLFVARELDLEDCLFYVRHPTKSVLVQAAAYGPKSPVQREILDPIEIEIGQGIVGTVAQTGVPENISDTRFDSRYIVDDAIRLSEMTVPVIARGQIIGVIDTECREAHGFSVTDFEYFELFANQISSILSAALLAQRIKSEDMAQDAVSLFVRVMKHTLLTPLTIVSMKSQSLQKGIFGALTPKQSKATAQIEANAARINQIFNDLFEFAQLQHGYAELEVEPTSLRQMAQEIHDVLTGMLMSRGIQLRVYDNFQDKSAMIDKNLLIKALERIAEVACHEVSNGGQVELYFDMQDDQLTIEMGNMLEPLGYAEIERLLRPFACLRDDQEHLSTSLTGIDLSLAHQAIKLHKGVLDIRTTSGKNIFQVIIPV